MSDAHRLPGLTVCVLCAGETLGEGDARPDGQLGRLRELALRGTVRLHEVECLDECNQGDVVVARPCAGARRRGGRPVWFSGVAGDEQTGVLEEWLACGGPGCAEVPEPIAGRRIDRGAGG